MKELAAIKLRLAKLNPSLSAEYHPAEDESVDPSIAITKNGGDTGLEIQIGPEYLADNHKLIRRGPSLLSGGGMR